MQPSGDYEDILREEKIKHLDFNGKKILDVGGGSGEVWKNQNISSDTRIDLVEPDPWLNLRAERKGIYDNLAFEYPSPNLLPVEEYDVVCILGVLEHMEYPVELLMQYDGARRFYITVPNANSFHRHVGMHLGMIQSLDELGPQDLAIGHKRVYTQERLIHDINQFNDITNYYYIAKFFGSTSFKFLSSSEMMELGEDRVRAINEVFNKLKIGISIGAELVIDLVRVDLL